MKQVLKTKQFQRMLRYFLLAVAVIAAYKIILEIDVIFNLLKQFLRIASPFLWGFVLAYVLSIPCSGLQKLFAKIKFLQKKSKLLAIFFTYLLLLLFLALILRLVIPSIYESVNRFAAEYQTYYNSIKEFVDYINSLNILNIDVNMDKLITAVRDFMLEKLPASLNTLLAVPSALLNGFLALISSVYILFEKDKFKEYLRRLLRAFFPEKACAIVFERTRDLSKSFRKYIYTQTIDGCIVGGLVTIELYLLGSPYAPTLGLMLGLVNYIPYFGSIIGSVIAIGVVALTQGLPVAVLTAVIILITQQIDGNIIQPKLMGDSFSLSPLLVIISITIGGALVGVWGMLVAIPIVATLKNILDDIIAYYEQKKAAQAHTLQDK